MDQPPRLTLRDKLVTLGAGAFLGVPFVVFVHVSAGVLLIPLFVLAILFAIDVLLHLFGWRYQPNGEAPDR